MAFDPFTLQHPMNREAVQPGLLNDNDRERSLSTRQRFLLKA